PTTKASLGDFVKPSSKASDARRDDNADETIKAFKSLMFRTPTASEALNPA
ncbi:hypothetical protein H2203_004856, partial [Taxawa tesnikishii (nom. ined.)]